MTLATVDTIPGTLAAMLPAIVEELAWMESGRVRPDDPSREAIELGGEALGRMMDVVIDFDALHQGFHAVEDSPALQTAGYQSTLSRRGARAIAGILRVVYLGSLKVSKEVEP